MNDKNYEAVCALWILLNGNVGTKRTYQLIKHFGSAAEAYAAKQADYEMLFGALPKQWICFLKKDLEPAKQLFEKCLAMGIHILSYGDPAYPECLRQIDQPPVALFWKGQFPDLNREPAVAIVGTREPDRVPRIVAAEYACYCGVLGIHVISGMAKGIDACAHVGAQYKGGKTVAVLGCGIDIVYPSCNYLLYKSIAKDGCLVSEYPPGTKPTKYTFPARNRIISGLSDATVIVAAPKRSGSIITARMALDQNRDVFVIPYQTENDQTQGNRNLMEEGAHICTNIKDIIQAYMPSYRSLIEPRLQQLHALGDIREDVIIHLNAKDMLDLGFSHVPVKRPKEPDIEPPPRPTADTSVLTEEERKLYDLLPAGEALTVDEISNHTGLALHEILFPLQNLEMKQCIRVSIGSKYEKII